MLKPVEITLNRFTYSVEMGESIAAAQRVLTDRFPKA